MKLFRIELFGHQTPSPRLRLFGPDGDQIAERAMPANASSWTKQIMSEYSKPAPNLSAVGRSLYDWLDDSAQRWFSIMSPESEGVSVHLQLSGDLQDLPWELVRDHALPLCGSANSPFTPIRQFGNHCARANTANRPMRVLFMASSPLRTDPILAFEEEERIILDATGKQLIELVVEESGSLAGLRQRLEWAGPGFFDVIHLTGHADVFDAGPQILMENDIGERKDASASDIARTLTGYWPRLLFLSGCKTGMAGANLAFPSLAAALVTSGAPAVLAWGQPVGDNAASLLAGHLYHGLAIGWSIDEAVARARFELFQAGLPAWHQLRIYADATPLIPIVTVPNSPERALLTIRSATDEFLDAGAQSKICSREQFVGRRRLIQRSLKTLRSSQGSSDFSEGLILHGMGGLGKSSTAARLCERMSGFERFVWVGPLDEAQLLRVFGERIASSEAQAELNDTRLSLLIRLKKLLQGYLLKRPSLFVFDDFEQNAELDNDQVPRFDAQQRMLINPVAGAILEALRKAIREANSQSRLIVTCCYDLPDLPTLHREPLDGLKHAELEKKLKLLGAFAQRNEDDTLRQRAVELSGGNPRLLEHLDLLLADSQTDQAKILDAMEQVAEEFRENILLRALLDQQHPDARRLLARLSIFRLPVREQIATQIAAPLALQPHLDRLVCTGLLEKIPAHTRYEYLVPALVEPLVQAELTPDQWQETYSNGTAALDVDWQAGEKSLVKGYELHRLSLLAKNADVAVRIGDSIANHLVNSSRFREGLLLCKVTRSLTDDFRILHTQARAEQVLGQSEDARTHFEQALRSCPETEGADNEVKRERASIVHNLAGLCQQQGDVTRAMQLWQESLELLDKIGDVQGKAATIHEMAGVIAQQGDVTRAMQLWQESLELKDKIGDVQGKAATLSNMAGVIAQQGDVTRAMQLWQESVDIEESIGDVKGKAATLSNMAWAAGKLGDAARERELNLQAASALAEVQAWLDLTIVLGNLGATESSHSMGYLAQALWLLTRTSAPIQNSVLTAATLLQNIGPESEHGPFVAAGAVYFAATRGESHPKRDELRELSFRMLAACAAARNVTETQFESWVAAEGLLTPAIWLPKLEAGLVQLVGDDEQWLFDRGLFQ